MNYDVRNSFSKNISKNEVNVMKDQTDLNSSAVALTSTYYYILRFPFKTITTAQYGNTNRNPLPKAY